MRARVVAPPRSGNERPTRSGAPIARRTASLVIRAAALTVLGSAVARGQSADPFDQWLASALEPLSLTGEDSNDPIPGLTQLARRATVIGLGESAHHKEELLRLRSRLTRELVESNGFRALLMETGYVEATQLDAWLSDPDASEPDFSRALPFAGDGEYEAIRSALRWLKRFNSTQPPRARVRFIGLDMSSGGGALRPPVERAWAFLDRVDGAFARESRARLSPVLDRLGSGYPSGAKQRYDSLSAVDREGLTLEIERLGARLSTRGAAFRRVSSAEEHESASQSVRIAGQTIEFMRLDGRDPANPRDQALARNAFWAMEQLPPGSRIVVWAHNAHVQKQSIDVPVMKMRAPAVSMGELLARRLGDGYAAIGTVVDQYAPDGSHADSGSVDARLARAGVPLYLVSLSAESASSATPAWLGVPRLMRFERTYIRVVPARAFDALVYVQRVSAGTVHRP